MKYAIKKTNVSSIKVSDDGLSINIYVDIIFNVDGGSKLEDSSTGTTVNLPLTTGERNTMLAELNSKAQDWFNANFNA